MKIVISDTTKVKIFATIFRQLKNLVADVNIDLYEDKMHIQGMDVAQACLFELLLQKDWFEEFEVDSPQTLGIHCETIFRMINCLEDEQKITMFKRTTTDTLSVNFDPISHETKTIKKNFDMHLFSIDTDRVDIPEKEYEADIIMNSEQFSQLITQLGIFGEELRINCNMETIDISSKGDHGRMTVSINDDDITEYAIEEDGLVNLLFASKFIQNICAFSKIGKDMYIHCSNDTPIKIHYSLDEKDSIDSKNYVRFFLAPKIED